MCLAVPTQVVEILENTMCRVRVGNGSTLLTCSTMLPPEPPKVGDYLIVHAGFAMHKLDPEEAEPRSGNSPRPWKRTVTWLFWKQNSGRTDSPFLPHLSPSDILIFLTLQSPFPSQTADTLFSRNYNERL